MKKLNKKMQILGAVVLAAGFASQAKADVSYQVVNSTADLETVNVSINGGSSQGVLAGGIIINETSNPLVAGTPASCVSICTDFGGSLYLGNTYNFANPVSTSPAPAGYPGTPAWSVQPYALENASTLFAKYSSVLNAGPNSPTAIDQAAGLQLAVWTALYDSTALGTFGGSYFAAVGSGGAYAVAAADLSSIAGITSFTPTEILLPTPDGSPQGNPDGNVPQGLFVAVPEASTVLSGSLLLLSFGVCSLKSFGKSRA